MDDMIKKKKKRAKPDYVLIYGRMDSFSQEYDEIDDESLPLLLFYQ